MPRLLFSFALIFLFTGCQHLEHILEELESKDRQHTPDVPGLAYALSEKSFDKTYESLITSLNGNDAITIVAEVNHRENAASVGLNLAPTRVVLFGNPKLGTALMQENQTAGIDLPPKIEVYQNSGKQVYAIYNSTEYLASRHGVGAAATLPKINDALMNLVSGATASDVKWPRQHEVKLREGLVIVKSSKGTRETYHDLKKTIESNKNLKIVAELDHAANAARVGLELRPTKLIIFGNPNLGTPLMQAAQTTGIDLPQKMLVWEDQEGDTWLAYNDPVYIAQRHGIKGKDEVISKIGTALAGLAKKATE